MSFESDVYAVLKSVCIRSFPDIAPASTQRPYITYQMFGGDVINPLNNSSPGKRNTYLQVNVWSSTRLEANNMSRQIEEAMRAATAFNARPQSALSSDYDPDVPVYGAAQDFSCWY